MPLSIANRFSLDLQRFLAKTFLVFEGLWAHFLFRYYFRYSVADRDQLRAKYKKIIKGNRPILICGNHLTLIDSIIHAVILNSIFGHFRNFSGLPWNVPERKNFSSSFYMKIFCYFGKCIPVDRQGTPEASKRARDKMLYVISKGDVLSIFPEGTRSRSGQIDPKNCSYGTGHLLQHFAEPKVLCIYMRGKRFGGFGNFPKKGEDFYLDMKLVSPQSELKGLRKVRALSTCVLDSLKGMEEEYFSNVGLHR